MGLHAGRSRASHPNQEHIGRAEAVEADLPLLLSLCRGLRNRRARAEKPPGIFYKQLINMQEGEQQRAASRRSETGLV